MTAEPDNKTSNWFALYCKSRHERQVRDRLLNKGVTAYIADYETRVMWGERRRKVRKNVLPGYVLIHADIDATAYLHILETQGVVKFVGEKWPALSTIPEPQIEAMQILIMLIFLPILFLSKWKMFNYLRLLIAIITCIAAIVWMFERISGNTVLT